MSALPAFLAGVAVTVVLAVPAAFAARALARRGDDDPWTDPDNWGRQ